MRYRFLAFLCAAVLLANCSSPLHSAQQILPELASPGAKVAHPAGTGTLVIRVKAPVNAKRSRYISASTATISVKITGPTNFKKTASLKLSGTGCKSKLATVECTLRVPGLTACPTKKPCYTGSVSTFDAAKHLLSADQKFKFAITSTSTTVPLILYGVPASIAIFPSANSILTGTQSSGFIEPKCSASTQTVDLVAQDADGNFIVGLGSPKPALSSSDTAQMTVSAASPAGAFALTPPAPPAYPYGNYTIVLTATATPSARSGGSSVTTHANVSYSGAICGIVTEFNVPSGTSSEPAGIVTGPDGALWFTESAANKIGRVTTTGSFSEFTGLTASSGPILIAVGPDGNLWFAEDSASKIGKITTAGAVTEYPTLTASAGPVSVAAGPDGNVWFTEASAGQVGVVSPTGTMHEYTIPTTNSVPQAIVAGPDGNLWFSEGGGNKVARVTTAGTITETTIPTAGSGPIGIAVGSDGELWYTESSANNIGRVQTSLLSTSINSEFALPESSSEPFLDALGPDGNIWFTESTGNRVASITPGGKISEYAVPTTSSVPFGITTGTDGAIWFAEAAVGKIARLR